MIVSSSEAISPALTISTGIKGLYCSHTSCNFIDTLKYFAFKGMVNDFFAELNVVISAIFDFVAVVGSTSSFSPKSDFICLMDPIKVPSWFSGISPAA